MRSIAAALACLILAARAPGQEGGELLANGGFEEEGNGGGESAGLPRGWSLLEGARSGDSDRASIVRVAPEGEGSAKCAVLSGGDDTHIWRVLAQEIEVEPGRTLRVSGRMRTADVRPAGRQFANSNLVVIFEGDRPLGVRATAPRLGTRAWEEVALRVEVPAGARRARVGCFLSSSGTAWFDDLSARYVEPPRWSKRSGEVYDMYWLDPDRVTEGDLAANEAACREAAAFLGVRPAGRIVFYKYADSTAKEEFTGDPGNAHVARDRMEIHSVFARDRHEVVHLLARELGNPPAILGEGLAVHLAGPWHGKTNRAWTAEFLADGRYIPLAEILDTRSFRARDDLVTYPECGAFVEFLVETHGWPRVRALFGASPADGSAEGFRKAFQDSTAEAFEESEARFREWAAADKK